MDSKVKEYLEKNILGELGLTDLPPARLEKLLLSLGEVMQGRINLRILDELSEEDKDELDKLSSSAKSEQEIQNFLKAKIPDLENIVAETIADSKQEIVDRAKLMSGI